MHNLAGKQCHVHSGVGNIIWVDAEQVLPQDDHICGFSHFEGTRFGFQTQRLGAFDGKNSERLFQAYGLLWP